MGKRKPVKQWWESLTAGDKVVLTYTDEFVREAVGTVGRFVAFERGGLKVELPDSSQYIFDDRHWTRYESEEQRQEIVANWNRP